jgi:heme/copper-type cytochrome/quinol oxidase subunit 1
MKIKVLSLILSLAFIGNACMAQYSFFKPLKKPVHPQSFTRAMSMGISPSLLKDSTINAFRPIVVAAAYAEPGNTLMAGAGFSFQSLTFDPNTQAW